MKTGCWELVLVLKTSFQAVSKDWQRVCSQQVRFALSLGTQRWKFRRVCGRTGAFLASAGRPSEGCEWKRDRGENRKKELRITGWLVEELARWKRVLPGPGPQRGRRLPAPSPALAGNWEGKRLADSGRNAAAAASGAFGCRKAKSGV